MADYLINNFLSSAVEIFSICCILQLLREIYKESSWKIAVIVAMLAGVTATFNALDIYINVGVNTFLITVAILILYQLKILDALFDAICVTVIYCTVQIFVMLILGKINNSLVEDERVLSVVMGILMIVGMCFFVISKISKIYIWTQKIYEEYKSELRWIFVNLFVIYQLYMVEWNERYFQFGDLKPLFIISFILILIMNLILMFQIMKSKKQRQENIKQNELNEMSEKFSDQMAAKQHEFSKHLQVIKGMSEQDNIAKSEIGKYISGLMEKRESEVKLVYTGDAAISGYLLEKKKEAKEKGINLETLISMPLPTLPCSRYDLIEIIGNLLSNAFEAVEGLENKNVFLEISKTEENSFLKVINGLDANLQIDTSQIVQKGFSTKKGEIRGYGLNNIKKIVEAHSGKMEISVNGEIMQIKILF